MENSNLIFGKYTTPFFKQVQDDKKFIEIIQKNQQNNEEQISQIQITENANVNKIIKPRQSMIQMNGFSNPKVKENATGNRMTLLAKTTDKNILRSTKPHSESIFTNEIPPKRQRESIYNFKQKKSIDINLKNNENNQNPAFQKFSTENLVPTHLNEEMNIFESTNEKKEEKKMIIEEKKEEKKEMVIEEKKEEPAKDIFNTPANNNIFNTPANNNNIFNTPTNNNIFNTPANNNNIFNTPNSNFNNVFGNGSSFQFGTLKIEKKDDEDEIETSQKFLPKEEANFEEYSDFEKLEPIKHAGMREEIAQYTYELTDKDKERIKNQQKIFDEYKKQDEEENKNENKEEKTQKEEEKSQTTTTNTSLSLNFFNKPKEEEKQDANPMAKFGGFFNKNNEKEDSSTKPSIFGSTSIPSTPFGSAPSSGFSFSSSLNNKEQNTEQKPTFSFGLSNSGSNPFGSFSSNLGLSKSSDSDKPNMFANLSLTNERPTFTFNPSGMNNSEAQKKEEEEEQKHQKELDSKDYTVQKLEIIDPSESMKGIETVVSCKVKVSKFVTDVDENQKPENRFENITSNGQLVFTLDKNDNSKQVRIVNNVNGRDIVLSKAHKKLTTFVVCKKADKIFGGMFSCIQLNPDTNSEKKFIRLTLRILFENEEDINSFEKAMSDIPAN